MKLRSVIFFLGVILFFCSCEKEYSYENGLGTASGTAVFSLGGSPLDCTGFTLAGNYLVGSALTTGNTVTFNVDVSTAGSYTISTDAANGITFSKTGNFTNAGSQTVTLEGSGTPTTSGDFTYTVVNDTSTCSFVVTALPAGPAAVGTLDCAGIIQAGTYTQGTALNSSNTITFPVNVTTAGSYSIATTIVNGVIFSGSGTLTSGVQNIVLTGNGTPVASGDSSFSVNFGSSSCNFSVNFLPGTAPSADYLKCDINGIAKTFNVNLMGMVQPVPLGEGFSIDGYQTSDSLSPALSLALFSSTGGVGTGTYNLFLPTNPTAIFCFPVYDDGSNTWSQSTNNQAGTFTIIVTAKTTNRITGTFSGTLYENDGAGPTAIQFTNGEFSAPY